MVRTNDEVKKALDEAIVQLLKKYPQRINSSGATVSFINPNIESKVVTSLMDDQTKSKDKEIVKLYPDYINHWKWRFNSVKWDRRIRLLSSGLILLLVIGLIIFGSYMAYLQFQQSFVDNLNNTGIKL